MALRERGAAIGWMNVATLPAFALLLVWFVVARNPLLVAAAAFLMLGGYVADRR